MVEVLLTTDEATLCRDCVEVRLVEYGQLVNLGTNYYDSIYISTVDSVQISKIQREGSSLHSKQKVLLFIY